MIAQKTANYVLTRIEKDLRETIIGYSILKEEGSLSMKGKGKLEYAEKLSGLIQLYKTQEVEDGK